MKDFSLLPPRITAFSSSFLAAFLTLGPVLASDALAAKLQPEAAKAWEKYIQWADGKVARELVDPSRFLIQDYHSPKEKAKVTTKLKAGEIHVQRIEGVIPRGAAFEMPEAAIHHWWGSILIPRITLDELLPFLKDYNHHAGRFREVEKSILRAKDSETYKFYFRLKRSNPFITVHYNTEQECVYRTHGASRASSRSVATRIAQLENAGTPKEREMTPGDDHGFLWRLVSWWRFQQTPEGVIVECESASLSRRIPFLIRAIPGLSGYLESVPKDSLENTLSSIRREAIAFSNNARNAKVPSK